MATRRCVLGVETPESRTQVYMSSDGELEVHANVTFARNTAGSEGGAASSPLDSIYSFLLWCCAVGFARVDLIRCGS